MQVSKEVFKMFQKTGNPGLYMLYRAITEEERED